MTRKCKKPLIATFVLLSIDAALFDKPIVNLDFDPEPGAPNQQLVKDVNHVWTHFKPVAESGGLWLVNNYEEMVKAILTYLKKPSLHCEQRSFITKYVCGYIDGNCGERIANAILDFAQRLRNKSLSSIDTKNEKYLGHSITRISDEVN